MMLTSTQIGELAAQFFIAGVGTLCFAILFACPRKSVFSISEQERTVPNVNNLLNQ